jgi:hypothetical protein
MSELVSAGANKLLVRFQDYLNRRATGKEPPITIKAKDLDENYKLSTVIEDPTKTDDQKSYSVVYEERGTYLTGISGLPEGAIAKEIDICENGQPASYWFVVWEEEPDLGQ